MKNFKDFNPQEIDETFRDAQRKLQSIHNMKWVKAEREGQTVREAREIVLNGDFALKKMTLQMQEGDNQWNVTVDDGIVAKSFNYKNTDDMLSMLQYVPSNMPSKLHHAQSNRQYRVAKRR